MSAEWSELFTVFEQSLSEWLSRAVEPSSAPVPRPSEPLASRLFAERLQSLQVYLDKAEQDAEQALKPLTADIQALQRWLDALTAANTKLSERASLTSPERRQRERVAGAPGL